MQWSTRCLDLLGIVLLTFFAHVTCPGAGKINHTEAYLTDNVGVTGEATHWMLDQGIKTMGTDAVTFDPPIWARFEGKQFLGNASRDVGAVVLPSGEHEELRLTAPSQLQAQPLSNKMSKHKIAPCQNENRAPIRKIRGGRIVVGAPNPS